MKTNSYFNKAFNKDLNKMNYQSIQPILRSRRTRREKVLPTEMVTNVSENKLRSFSFQTRYKNNTKHGRLTSVIGYDTATSSFRTSKRRFKEPQIETTNTEDACSDKEVKSKEISTMKPSMVNTMNDFQTSKKNITLPLITTGTRNIE